ncbi:aminotransferase class V-fold PLP-dependent enzyme [Streptomyces sp. NBC_01214]|uniref:aminotransferase class V-fold PLP-dependent enzyme n=1 Tax=Streptomyces sp. NBC_01214 TaxID=2903777 RepID=UPI00225AB3E6|nr:aminotransferase class V-fold PLP-dependent enzyme [Streptomyces sp. NBC_01214]MCX4808930.1 aminotransferase class V-fold PLP-dependent enzyme [Streptomyces sp. NBC_01214]
MEIIMYPNPFELTHARQLFSPSRVYLDTATYGLASEDTAHAITNGVAQWREGTGTLQEYDAAVDESRASYGFIVGSQDVAVGGTTANFMAMVAASLPPGGEVLLALEDFTSVTWPFLVRETMQDGCRVRAVPLAQLAEAVTGKTRLIAVSAVQSRDGTVSDLDAVKEAAAIHQARTLIDVTQAAGWFPINANSFDFVVCSSYKWLLTPRGVAFMTVSKEVIASMPPTSASWYAGSPRAQALYASQLLLPQSAHRFDVSPAWLCWLGALPALKLINSIGVDTINAHNVGLANRFRAGLNMPSSNSAIVSVTSIPDAEQRLADAGVKASVRGGGVRLAFHLYNTDEHVDIALNALT